MSSVEPTVTWNASAVRSRSMRSVKRTEIAAVRSTASSPARGRKRTTPGASEVRTARAGTLPNATPSASTRPGRDTV